MKTVKPNQLIESRQTVLLQHCPQRSGTHSQLSRRVQGNKSSPPNFPFVAILIPFLFISWTIITLQTQAGKLVIECEASDVSVRLLRDGVVYDALEVKNGEASTRLFAGKYEVIIDSPSDAILTEGDSILVKRGETTIAHIKIDKDSKKQPAKTAEQTNPEKLYMGKPLEYWLDVVDREQHPESILDALHATAVLVADQRAKVGECLLRRMPQWSSTIATYFKLEIQYSGQNTSRQPVGPSVDQKAFAILLECRPGKQYFELLAQQLADEEAPGWKTRILTVGAKYPFERNLIVGLDATKPLTDWLESNVLSKTKNHELLTSTIDLYFHWMHLDSLIESDKQSIFNSLVESKLSCEEWVSVDIDRFRSQGLFSPLENEFEQQAMKCLTGLDRSAQLKACCFLRHWKAQKQNGRIVRSHPSFHRKEDLVAALEKLLTDSLSNTDLLTRTYKMSTRIGKFEMPILPPGVPSSGFSAYSENAEYLFTRELLKLADVVDISHELAPLVLKVYKATDSLSQELASTLQMTPIQRITFPELVTTPPNVGTREQWIAALVHAQAFASLPERARTEITKMAERGMELARDTQPAIVDPPIMDAGRALATKHFEKYDRNRDGKLSPEEYGAMIIKPDGADINRDGFITFEEYADFRRNKK